MYKSRLRTRFSALLRTDPRSISFLHHHCNFEAQTMCARPVSSASPHLLESRVCGVFSQQFPWKNSFFPEKTFCSQSHEEGVSKCWNCKSNLHMKPSLVCESCCSIQPVDHSIDYFQIFGLENKFDIEESSLDGKYKNWQKKLHPDLVHSKSERERGYAVEQSARTIDAYRTLNNSLSRAIYLMKLQGIHVDEEQTVSDPNLLGEIMEIREAVEEAADSQVLKEIQAQVEKKLRNWSESFLRAFQSQNTEEAVDSIRRMTYYYRVNEEIVKKL